MLFTVTVLPHPSLPVFKGDVLYGAAFTVKTALGFAYRGMLDRM